MTPVEWCRKNDVWYLKIDLDIPEIIIKEAQAVYDEGFFMDLSQKPIMILRWDGITLRIRLVMVLLKIQ